MNWKNPAHRAQAVERIRAIENRNKERARAKAKAMGIPMRQVLPNGTVTEIMGLDENGEFLINRTRNANAAISSAANLVNAAPYNLDGTGITVGVWDESAVRVTHQEFQTSSGSRVTVRDGATALSNHATHVAGTVNAAGVSITRKGMAPNALVDSYDWTNDDSEMAAAGASAPSQPGKITISNHSYGYIVGWAWNGSNWQWYGTGTDQNAYAAQFGQYSFKARDWDLIAYNAPYYLIFHSAGNDNTNNPANGSQVLIGGSLVAYDSSIHPLGDGVYRNGFENIGHQATSKNIMVVGAANDAVTNGLRDPAKSTLTTFSSRGPTDDGRIKPDIVANGASLVSTSSAGDTAYATMSGTSMSGPSAAGSAALLVDLYRSLFPGSDMRASTLKGLIIHTATDIGNPGPDYHYGWGLIDTKTAADLILAHHANPEENRMVEETLTTAVPLQTYTFAWDGVSPIRATLAWTDPAAPSTTAHDSRISRLVNDLDLKIIAPDGTQHYPFVMPFVGTWTVESMSAHATTGINSTDNVEQVLIENPAQSGQWTVEVSYKGTLTNNLQDYSLLTSGLSAAPLSMEVARGGSPISVGGADGVSGTSIGSGTQLSYTIANVGGGQLELTTPVTISNPQGCSVTVNTQPATLVNGGESTNLVATVTPTAGGTWSFNVSIANNDSEKDPYHWFVTGIAGSSSSVSFTPVADTYIFDQSTGTNYGTEPQISLNNRTGGAPASRAVLRGLLRFDLSAIPPGVAIESATLDFVQNNNVSGLVNIVEATASWGETTATWSNSNAIFGTTSYGTASSGTAAGASLPAIALNLAGLSKIQDWVNTPSNNYGFGIITDNNGEGEANWLALRSREHPTSAHHPRLTVTYGGGGSVDAPLMLVSGNEGVIPNGGTESIAETQAAVGTQLTYPIQNLGTADLTLTAPATATALSNCTITFDTQPSGTVAASASTDLVLTATPLSAGAWSATVSITSNDADKNPYTWTISGSASKTQASLVLNGLAQTYDGTPRVVTATTTPPGMNYSVTYDGLSEPPVNAGNYEVVATVTDPDFEGTTTGTLEVSKASQTIAFAPLDSASIEDGPFSLTATASSGLPVAYISSNPSVASISGNTVTPITIGTTTITATQPGDGNFEAAQNVPQTLSLVADGQIALGGDVAFIDGFYIHTFTQDGSFELLGESAINVEVLVVGGGGGGGSSTAFGTAGAGGGGAGGLIYRQAFEVAGPQSVVVGAPGARAGTGNTPGNNGGDSAFGSLVALGGGGGSGGNMQGLAGGSGGGSRNNLNGGAGQQPTSTSGGFGNAGGGWTSVGGDGAGGGGGAGEAAPSSPPHDPKVGGPGGLGLQYEISGAPAFYAGGGGGGASGTSVFGQGGQGGGGNGANNDTPATPGAPNTGGGGGGGNNSRVGADGGSGIVIVRYPGSPAAATYTVNYQGNGNDGGTVPIDDTAYNAEALVTVLANTGSLTKAGYAFTGWNTAANGTGTGYLPDDVFTITADVTLYAQWTANPVASFAISGVPSQVNVGAVISGITVTALDEVGATASSFTGTVTYGGTAGITGTSGNFTDGVLQGVSITPLLTGSSLTFTVEDGAGHTGSATFNVVSTAYNDWAAENNLTGEEADPAAILQPDGFTNLQKFAFGMSPTVVYFDPVEFVMGGGLTAPGAPTIRNMATPVQADQEHAVFTRLKNHAAAGLNYTVEFSADLKVWTPSVATTTVLTDEASTSDYEAVSVPFSDAVPVETGGDPRPPKFMRVVIATE
ncbi:MAG: S8 family serine peptidase [Opitutales bacterium]